MKRQNLKAPIVVSGIFIITLLTAAAAMFFQLTTPNLSWLQKLYPELLTRQPSPTRIPALRGHWLRTAGDPAPVLPEMKPPGEKGITDREVPRSFKQAAFLPQDDRPSRYLNRTTANINILYFWTDGPQLKVISITSFNKQTKEAAIMVIPLQTQIDAEGTTIAELYRKAGRAEVKKRLEERLEINIPNFVQVSQEALRKLSDLVGSFNINGDRVTMADAFEQTAAGLRTDDRDIVKAVGSRVMTPGMVLKVPKLLWIFTHDIKSNFSTEEMVQLFNFSRRLNLGEMRKLTLPGTEYVLKGEPRLFVYSETWKNVIYDVTQ